MGNNTILEFQGGSLSNVDIDGNNTFIDAPLYKIFGTDLKFNGSFRNSEFNVEWFWRCNRFTQ